SGWGIAAGMGRAWFMKPARAKLLARLSGTVLIGGGIWLSLARRPGEGRSLPRLHSSSRRRPGEGRDPSCTVSVAARWTGLRRGDDKGRGGRTRRGRHG